MTEERPWARRLPRSNVPLPDESLAGYVVNLAYRLDLPPSEIVRRLGIKPPKRATLLDLTFAVSLPPDAADHFAHAAGLTTDQVHKLTLDGYGPVLDMAAPGKRLTRSDYGNKWVNPGRTRACPACLKQAPHPKWNLRWITPWALACPMHNILLIDDCPACYHPLGSPGPGSNRSLIPSLALAVTHPAACRTATGPRKTCGQRIDEVNTSAAGSELLDLQRRLDAAITRGAETDNQWLRDLRLINLLLLGVGLPFDYDGPYANDAQQHIDQQHLGDTAGRHNTVPPASASAAAGLLLAADTLLRDAQQTETLAELNDAALRRANNIWSFAKNKGGPSVVLDEAMHRTRRSITQPRRLAAYLPRLENLRPEHVPAYLPADLFAQHLSDARQPSQANQRRSRYERQLRRYAPIAITMHLAQIDVIAAGRFLGYTDVLTSAACARASEAFRDRGGEPELFRRVAAIATHYDQSARVNYRLRRAYFDADWRISDDAWRALQQALWRENTPWKARHVEYSAWIWHLVTSGDPILAPMTRVTENGRSSAKGARLAHDYLRWGAPTLEYLSRLAESVALNVDSATAAC